MPGKTPCTRPVDPAAVDERCGRARRPGIALFSSTACRCTLSICACNEQNSILTPAHASAVIFSSSHCAGSRPARTPCDLTMTSLLGDRIPRYRCTSTLDVANSRLAPVRHSECRATSFGEHTTTIAHPSTTRSFPQYPDTSLTHRRACLADDLLAVGQERLACGLSWSCAPPRTPPTHRI